MVRCLSLTDTFWMKRADEDLRWERVSLYRNPFDDDSDAYLASIGPRIGADFASIVPRGSSPLSTGSKTRRSKPCWSDNCRNN